MPRRSLTAVAYSVRVMRCIGTCPAIGWTAARSSFAFRPGHERVDVSLRRLTASRRRHQTAAQFADGLLPDIGMVADRVERQPVERKTSGMHSGAVTAGAVRVDHGARLRRAALLLAQRAGHDGDGETEAKEASHRARAPAEEMIALPEFSTSDFGYQVALWDAVRGQRPVLVLSPKPVRCAWRAFV